MFTDRATEADEVCGVVLAGGNSSRIGRDKALLEWDGRPLIAHVAEALRSVAGEVLISCASGAPYSFLELPCIPDRYPGQGPLAGLHAAFHATSRPLLLVVACDMPFVRPAFLRTLLAQFGRHHAVIPCTSDGRAHPLCALYARACVPLLDRRLAEGRNTVMNFLEDPALEVRYLSHDTGAFNDLVLTNVNKIEDLKVLERDGAPC